MATITNDAVRSDTRALSLSKAQLWAGRILSGLPALFLLFDGIMKLVKKGKEEATLPGTGFANGKSSSLIRR
jgi:hypothetical protein